MFRHHFHLCCLLLCLLTSGQSFAQQSSYNYFYRNNWQLVNPAAIDRSHYLTKNHPTTVLNAGSRLQWIGLEGAPLLYFISAEYCPEPPMYNRPNYKLGVTAYGDRTDAISTYAFYGNYSYFFLLPWAKGHTLHLGGSVGYVQYGVAMNRINGPDKLNDAVLLSNEKRSFADFAIGAMYRIRKQFYMGISSPQTFGVNLTRDSIHSQKVGLRQVNLTGGWFINRGERTYTTSSDDLFDFMFEPSIIVRYAPGVSYNSLAFLNNSPFSIDVNLRVHYQNKFWYGGGVSTNGSMTLEGGISRDMGNDTRMQLGGGYSIPVFQRYGGLGHSVEVNMGYYFN